MRVRSTGILAALAAATLASACATAPRGPAGSLADAGVRATTAFAGDVDDLALRLERADAGEAFATTWQVCQNAAVTCSPRAAGGNGQVRRDLAAAVRLRGRALRALGDAYAALRIEADYDGRGDLGGATREAAGAVDAFATSIAKLSPASPIAGLVGQPVAGVAGLAGELAGERSQRRRILRASRTIGAATERLRIALQAEAAVFATISDYVGTQRTEARLAMLEAGIVSPTDLIAPMARDLDVRFAAGADAAVGKSVAARAAVAASVRALSTSDIAAMKARYDAAGSALGALAGAHRELEAGRGASLEDVARTLAAIDAALPTPGQGSK